MHGQGRSLLRRDGPAEGPLAEGRGRVGETDFDPRAAAGIASTILWRAACAAEVDDEVQLEVTRAWLSGRGLPLDRTTAHREVARRVVQRVLTATTQRGQLGRYRRESHDAMRPDSIGTASRWGSPSQVEATVDAGSVVREALRVPRSMRRGLSPEVKAAEALASAVDGGTVAELGAALGVSPQAAHDFRTRLIVRLREWACARPGLCDPRTRHSG